MGLVVTLRREKMYAFLEKFIKIVLPRIRDFRGLSPNNFDARGRKRRERESNEEFYWQT